MRRAAILVTTLAALATPARAQVWDRLTLGGGLGTTRLTTSVSGTTGTQSGVSLFGAGHIGSGRFFLSGFYRQGTLKADTGSSPSEDLVDGLLLAQARVLPWLTIGAGPHARAIVVSGSTEQWTFVEGHVRAESDVIPSLVSAHLELWDALTAHSNGAGSGTSGRGGEAGLTLRLPRSLIFGRLLYSVDRAAAGARTETLEDVTISVGYGRP